MQMYFFLHILFCIWVLLAFILLAKVFSISHANSHQLIVIIINLKLFFLKH